MNVRNICARMWQSKHLENICSPSKKVHVNASMGVNTTNSLTQS